MTESLRVCAVIPVYNHAHLVGDTLARLQSQGLDCLLVNDGGDAQATAILTELSRTTGCELIEQRPNGGKGRAVVLGMHHAANRGYTHALQIDADGQHDTDDVPHLLALAQANPDAVITGIPNYDDSVPKHRLYSRYITHVWVWIETLSFEIKDSMCGYRVYPLASVVDLSRQVTLGGRMDFDTEVLVRLYWRGVRVISLPTRVVYPEHGVSNFRLWRDNVVISWMHTRLVCGMLLRLPKLLYWALRGRGNG
ncbi:glycosyltransferase family 2 protein [Gilvimarinus chinensis]|uniref:glycosyltransferase family 2 protein n=1 Tax=Gilvimarinus chinensis TaxID=396005 RepID=UPI0003607DEC|nr:glycosyltransferase family 2 protein [Gilvimarinus chinensis]